MKIFADFHHSGLAYSLHLLFEKRLGYELYFPIGTEWFEKGYWAIAEPYSNSPETIRQYLDLDHRYEPKDGTVSLNTITDVKATHYEIADYAHGYTRKCITWKQFMDMDVDIIVGSIPRHWELYKQLKDIYKKNAKVVCQMGNMFNEIYNLMRDGIIHNLMSSTSEFESPSWTHKIFYHQEIDQGVFKWKQPTYDSPIRITSFVNCLPKPQMYVEYKFNIPKCDMRAYGAGCPDGNIQTIQEMAKMMGESHWAWHVKPQGDGFGHVWFDWGFIGRPIITNFSDYKDKLAGEIFEDGVTGIDLERRSMKQNIELIQELSQPEKHLRMCKEIHRRTKEKINYRQEEKHMREFIQDLR